MENRFPLRWCPHYVENDSEVLERPCGDAGRRGFQKLGPINASLVIMTLADNFAAVFETLSRNVIHEMDTLNFPAASQEYVRQVFQSLSFTTLLRSKSDAFLHCPRRKNESRIERCSFIQSHAGTKCPCFSFWLLHVEQGYDGNGRGWTFQCKCIGMVCGVAAGIFFGCWWYDGSLENASRFLVCMILIARATVLVSFGWLSLNASLLSESCWQHGHQWFFPHRIHNLQNIEALFSTADLLRRSTGAFPWSHIPDRIGSTNGFDYRAWRQNRLKSILSRQVHSICRSLFRYFLIVQYKTAYYSFYLPVALAMRMVFGVQLAFHQCLGQYSGWARVWSGETYSHSTR